MLTLIWELVKMKGFAQRDECLFCHAGWRNQAM